MDSKKEQVPAKNEVSAQKQGVSGAWIAVLLILSIIIFAWGCFNGKSQYNEGHDSGYSQGYDEGYEDGYTNGHAVGYTDGRKSVPWSDNNSSSTYSSGSSSYSSEPQSYTVYITKTGEKYHSYGCQYLRQSCIAIDKDDAIAQGYSPCSKCNP